MSGLAMIAGSNPSLLAPIGKREPTIFAVTITNKRVTATISEISRPTLSNNIHFKNPTRARKNACMTCFVSHSSF